MLLKEQMMKATILKDNNIKIPEESIKNIPALTEKITNKTLGKLKEEGIFVFPEDLKEAEDVDSKQMILQKENGVYKTGNVMGFLGYKNERLIISSRFSTGKEDFFLSYMLQKVMNLPNLLELSVDSASGNGTLDILSLLFPYYLKKAVRKGIFKTYTRNEYNDCNIKGTIDIARHIKQNTPFVGKIAYTQREQSYDNYITELIRHTAEFIKGKPYGKYVLNRVKDELKKIDEATPTFRRSDLRRVLAVNKKNTIRHAYYSEYRELQRLCILILQSSRQDIGFGSNEVQGILFDGSWLWEEYVNTIINKDNKKFYHPKNRTNEGREYLFDAKKVAGLIFPDFISKNTPRIIADAKYKRIENINGGDYLQVLAYMYRFESKKGFYLYPDTEQKNNAVLKLLSGLRAENSESVRSDVELVKLGLKIPSDAKDYNDFVAKIKLAEQEFVKKIS